jgi:hypothetical protein
MLKLLVKTVIRYWKTSLVLALLVSGLAGFWVYQEYFATTPPQKIAEFNFDYQSIKPGATTHQELIDELGVFDTQYNQDNFLVYTYNTDKSRYAPNRFYLLNDVVVMKELNFNPLEYSLSSQSIKQSYGEPEKKLYDVAGLLVGAINEVLVYPEKGLAVYVRPDKQLVYKVQFFAPITLTTYREVWGKELVETKPSPTTMPKHTD